MNRKRDNLLMILQNTMHTFFSYDVGMYIQMAKMFALGVDDKTNYIKHFITIKFVVVAESKLY